MKEERNMMRLFNNKGMTTTAALLLVTGTVALGTAGGVVGYNVYQDKKHEEEVATFMQEIDKAQHSAIDSYNARVEQAMSELTFTNENGEMVTIETNRNIDSMNNVVNNLNGILGELNNDALLLQEQKDVLVMAINEKINNVNARIDVVNEENRIEEERKAEEERIKAEAAKAKKESSKSKSSSSKSYSNSDNSDSGDEGNSSGEVRNYRGAKWIDLGDGYGKWEGEGGAWVEAHPEWGINKRFYDRTGVIAAGIKMKEEHPESTVHFSGMGIDKTI